MATRPNSGKTRGDKGTKAKSSDVFGFDPLACWPLGGGTDAGKRKGRACILGIGAKSSDLDEWALLPAWLKERAEKRKGELLVASTEDGPLWILMPQRKTSPAHGGQLDLSPYGAHRDLAGLLAGAQLDYGLSELEVRFFGAEDEEILGALVGLGIGSYRYRGLRQGRGDGSKLPRLTAVGVPYDLLQKAQALAGSVNLARHLVNVPASELNPKTFTDATKAIFRESKTMTVDVWEGQDLADERMGLLQAVGAGAVHGPALVRMRYRPAKTQKGKASKPLAFVGKGITFDTGGLDLKDAASMRLMKKDMGGAGSILALAYWVHQTALPVACDFYLALAENAVDERSFRPGDVLMSRGGVTVEIDNTDAEGRLVLADAIDFAVKEAGADQPELLINLATLTGAMRIALGTRLAGMFATEDQLASDLMTSAQTRADPAWRMPLVSEYLLQLKSTVADLANSGPGRFGGAITAALFLQRFVSGIPWAHFDMYAWTDPNIGGCTEVGGNGQCVQLLADFLDRRAGR